MKKIIFILMVLGTAFLIYSEAIILKDGSILKGIIINSNENSITVKTINGELTVKKDLIKKVIISDEGSEKKADEGIVKEKDEKIEKIESENKTTEIIDEKKTSIMDIREFQKQNSDYKAFRGLLGGGIGTLVPGIVLLPGAIVCLIYGGNYYNSYLYLASLTSSQLDKYENPSYYMSIYYMYSRILIIAGAALLSVSVILDITGIILLAVSGSCYNKYIKAWNENKKNISFNFGYDIMENSTKFYLSYKF